MPAINIILGEDHFKKDPQSSELGHKIVREGIVVLDDLGFEEFTFKKLAERIESTETSIYRYFENKHQFLVYLSTYYWAWLEHVIDFETHHMQVPSEKLERVIDIICHSYELPNVLDLSGISLTKLRRVIDNESDKTYLNRQVDECNKKGLFMVYKGLCKRLSQIVEEINPSYLYPRALVSTLMEAARQQTFFAQHLPALTELELGAPTALEQQSAEFIKHTVRATLKY